MRLAIIATLATTLSVACGSALEATDSTLPVLLEKGVPTMLDIYASWCGHCKRLAPVWDELADTFAHAADKVQFLKIDGDKHTKSTKQFNIQYFPTVKFLDAKGKVVEDVDARDLDSLIEYVEKHTSAKRKTGGAKTGVDPVELSDANFAEVTKNKPAIAAFTTTWCGHCKRLKPTYRELAGVFARDDVVIGQVDCTEDSAKQLAEKYGVGSYPTILFFPADGSDPIPYSGNRGLPDFVQFVNENAGLARDLDGSLTADAGKVAALDELAFKLATGGKATYDQLQAAAKEAGEKGKPYLKYAEKVTKDGLSYANKELARLGRVIASGNIAPLKLDELKKKLNVLSSFIAAEEGDEKEDL